MATPGMPPQAPDPRVATLYASALVVAVVSGICALAALAVGSPLQFGVALALFGAAWITADFTQRTVERERELAARRCAIPVPTRHPGYGYSRVVYAGGYEHFSRPAPRAGTGLAA